MSSALKLKNMEPSRMVQHFMLERKSYLHNKPIEIDSRYVEW